MRTEGISALTPTPTPNPDPTPTPTPNPTPKGTEGISALTESRHLQRRGAVFRLDVLPCERGVPSA